MTQPINIKYKIVRVFPQENQIIARFYTDLIPEESLVSRRDREGNPIAYRTDYAITLPLPSPTGEELEKYIMAHCPVNWFVLMEQLKTQGTSQSVSGIEVGVEKSVTIG